MPYPVGEIEPRAMKAAGKLDRPDDTANDQCDEENEDQTKTDRETGDADET